MTIADVDTETNQIVNTLYQTVRSVKLGKDLTASSDGYLSQEIQKKLIDTLSVMKTDTAEFASKQWFGIGTSVFRKAKNGLDLLGRIQKELDLTILLVPQIEEGEIGFFTAVAASKMNAEDVNAWDSGSASFQISTLTEGHIEMFGAEFAYDSTLEALFSLREQLFSQNLSPNFLTIEEATKLAEMTSKRLPLAPNWITDSHKKMIAIGENTSIFFLASVVAGQTTYTKNQVWEGILSLCDSGDECPCSFPEPGRAVVALVLLYSVMDHCGIDSVSYFLTNGGCEGILTMPRYWQ